MRRRFVIAIAFLSVNLVAGSCEFRATSNNPVHPPPPVEPAPTPPTQPGGLLVNISVGDSGAAAQGSFGQASVVEAALATSVLSIPEPTPAATRTSAIESPKLRPQSMEWLAAVTVSEAAPSIGSPSRAWAGGRFGGRSQSPDHRSSPDSGSRLPHRRCVLASLERPDLGRWRGGHLAPSDACPAPRPRRVG